MAEALVKRGKTVWAAGGVDLPFEDAVLRLTNRLGGPGARICFLLDLATSPFGRRKLSVLIPRVAEEFERIGSAAELTAPGVTPQEVRDGFGRRLRAAGIPRALAEGLIAKITAIPDEKRVTAPLISHSHETYDIRNPEPPAPRLVLTYQGRELVLQEGGAELVIGRATDCGIVLDHASASRRHLLVGVRGDGFVVEDLSRNGTCLVPAGGEPRLLRQGDLAPLAGRGEIVIGSTEIGEKPARIAWEVMQKR
ncbi:FHA domain-containing protein [Azospirillum thermophilum]|uniref:FHA domain-containing protein n=1 Tax=Azospirillum thermophilum TaxID=2202148 RepID=UPI001FEC1C85|nr:FHA domain-containing protein [Azospirillum thermophilum]